MKYHCITNRIEFAEELLTFLYTIWKIVSGTCIVLLFFQVTRVISSTTKICRHGLGCCMETRIYDHHVHPSKSSPLKTYHPNKAGVS